ncbi:MAG: type II secretion system protein M [Bdellovibrionales bacterium]|nr:type II secretion system protein M [Bdellovibrionales bacterium]
MKRLQQLWARLQNDFKEQVWEQEHVVFLRHRFTELEPRQQYLIQLGLAGLATLGVLGVLLAFASRAWDRQERLREINGKILMLDQAAEQIRDLKTRAATSGPSLQGVDLSAPLPELAEALAMKASIAKGSIEVSSTGSAVKLSLSQVSIRQLVRLFYFLENQVPGVEWQSLKVDARDDVEGYLWAEFQLNARKGR